MRKRIAAILYTALLMGANLAHADLSEIAAMRDGDMKKLNFHSEAKPVSTQSYLKDDGSEGLLSDHQGKVVLLNFWATWCAPCRHEMPMLSELQTELGGDNFEVVTLATGRNAPPAMKKFFAQIGVDNLPLHRDPKQKIARDMGVLGLPITVILNEDGQEIARLRGDADWSSENAKAILNAVIARNADAS
ncbi:TlpA disulfide reductase family protein [Planktotalea sp.]|uniref:TlpA disulfide reductase family protein n=1 Tax=Planktotalea sp. TaxID=2029877 RepID=UPI00329989BC